MADDTDTRTRNWIGVPRDRPMAPWLPYATVALIIVGVAIGIAGARTAAIILLGGGVVLVALAADWDLRRRRANAVERLRADAPSLTPPERSHRLRRLEREYGGERTAMVRELRDELEAPGRGDRILSSLLADRWLGMPMGWPQRSLGTS